MTTYQFDPTGTLPANKVVNEQQALTPNDWRDYATLIPSAAPFYGSSLIVKHLPSGRILREGQDYSLTHRFYEASLNTAKPVYGSITLNDKQLSGVIQFVQYQTVGGEWTLDAHRLQEILANRMVNPRVVTWEQLVETPVHFPVIDHRFNVKDLTGMKDVENKLEEIRQAIRQRSGNGIAPEVAEHIADRNNPHQVTKTQIGLSNVQNYGVASDDVARQGTSSSHYVTPRGVAAHVANAIAGIQARNTPGTVRVAIDRYYRQEPTWLRVATFRLNTPGAIAYFEVNFGTGSTLLTGNFNFCVQRHTTNLETPYVAIVEPSVMMPELAIRHVNNGEYELYVLADNFTLTFYMECLTSDASVAFTPKTPAEEVWPLPDSAMRFNQIDSNWNRLKQPAFLGNKGRTLVYGDKGPKLEERMLFMNVFNADNDPNFLNEANNSKDDVNQWIANFTEMGFVHNNLISPSSWHQQRRWSTAGTPPNEIVTNLHVQQNRSTYLMTPHPQTDYYMEVCINPRATTGQSTMGQHGGNVGVCIGAIEQQGRWYTLDVLRTPGGVLKAQDGSINNRTNEYRLLTIGMNLERQDCDILYADNGSLKWGDGVIRRDRNLNDFNPVNHGWDALGKVTIRVIREGNNIQVWVVDGDQIPMNTNPVFTLDLTSNPYLQGLFANKPAHVGFIAGRNSSKVEFLTRNFPQRNHPVFFINAGKIYQYKGDPGKTWVAVDYLNDINRLFYSPWNSTFYHAARNGKVYRLNVLPQTPGNAPILIP